MANTNNEYELLAGKINAAGLDLELIKDRLKKQAIETPSWGYANSGTRFQAFPLAGRGGNHPPEAG